MVVDFDRVAFSIFGWPIHWYGLMYLIGFVGGWWLGRLRTRRKGTEWRAGEIGDLVFYFALGAVLGGRIGYTLMFLLMAWVFRSARLVLAAMGVIVVGNLVALGVYGAFGHQLGHVHHRAGGLERLLAPHVARFLPQQLLAGTV